MAEATTTFDVGLTCEGCANAVRRILGKLGVGADAIAVDIPAKRVVVTHDPATVTPDAMLAALKKWGDASGKAVALA